MADEVRSRPRSTGVAGTAAPRRAPIPLRPEPSDAAAALAIEAIATKVHTLADLDEVLAAFRSPPNDNAFSPVGRLDPAQRAELLHQMALRLPATKDVVPYRALARADLLKACADLPEPHARRLHGLQDGSMFADHVEAVKAGVPVDVVVRQRGIFDEAVIERLNWEAEYVAAGHLYVGLSVEEAARLQGITSPQAKAALEKYSVESAAGAMVMSRTMSVEDTAQAFGIHDRDEIDRLHEFAAWDNDFIARVRVGDYLPDVYETSRENDRLSPMHAEMLAIMSSCTARRWREGATPARLADEIPVTDPLAWRLLNNLAAKWARSA